MIVARLEEAEALCIMKNASAFESSKSQMLPSLLPLLASIFKVLPLPQKLTVSASRFRFCFHIPAANKAYIGLLKGQFSSYFRQANGRGGTM